MVPMAGNPPVALELTEACMLIVFFVTYHWSEVENWRYNLEIGIWLGFYPRRQGFIWSTATFQFKAGSKQDYAKSRLCLKNLPQIFKWRAAFISKAINDARFISKGSELFCVMAVCVTMAQMNGASIGGYLWFVTEGDCHPAQFMFWESWVIFIHFNNQISLARSVVWTPRMRYHKIALKAENKTLQNHKLHLLQSSLESPKSTNSRLKPPLLPRVSCSPHISSSIIQRRLICCCKDQKEKELCWTLGQEVNGRYIHVSFP